MEHFTEQEIAFIISKKEENDLSWIDIADKYNKKFKQNRTFDCVRKCYSRYKDIFSQKDNHVRTLKTIHRTKKTNGYTGKENRTILQLWNERDDLIETIENTVKKISLKTPKMPKIKSKKKDKKKNNMTFELLFSDIHFGKQIFDEHDNIIMDSKEIKKRIDKLAKQVIKEINRNKQYFNVDKIIVAMLGDLIESSHMHESESVKGSEFSTSRQIYECIEAIFQLLLIPLALTGMEIEIPCVTGNHDRMGLKKTYVKPGEDNLTYVIYKTLELLCKKSNFNNIKFKITNKLFIDTEVYGNTIVYEHGDEVKGLDRTKLTNMMNRRQSQLNKVVHFYRIAHWHESITYGQGNIQVNASLTGQDDYSESKGFNSEALQILNSYVKTDKRRTCFFRSFPIYLEERKPR